MKLLLYNARGLWQGGVFFHCYAQPAYERKLRSFARSHLKHCADLPYLALPFEESCDLARLRALPGPVQSGRILSYLSRKFEKQIVSSRLAIRVDENAATLRLPPPGV